MCLNHLLPVHPTFRLTEAEIKESDFQAYLGSDDDGDDDVDDDDRAGPEGDKDADKIRERYRSVVD